MVIVIEKGASEEQVEQVIDHLNRYGFDVHRSSGKQQTILGAIGVKPDFDHRHIALLDGVADVYRVTEPYKFASRAWKKADTVIDVQGVAIGGTALTVMAGPCAVESEAQIFAAAEGVARAGATFLRGGAFKPRSSPYSFQGLGEEGLRLLRAAADAHGLRVITEVMETEHIDVVGRYADVLQIGARNMQNFALLKAIGASQKPVMLKRGLSATIEEWLMSAEYLMAAGNHAVILCERGIRTFETITRNTLDLSAVPVVKARSHLPVLVDPSHGTGLRNMVTPMARAAVAAGADGLMVEIHPNPPEALSDGPQSLYIEQFLALMNQVRAIAPVVGRALAD